MSLTWPGRLEPATISAPALLVDLAPTIARLLELEPPSSFVGYDWTPTLREGGQPPSDRLTHYQAHKGAVISDHDSDLARRSGLLEVAVIQQGLKEIFRIKDRKLKIFDLGQDPQELENLATAESELATGMTDWMGSVQDTLNLLDQTTPEPLDEEQIEQLRSLGYIE